MLKKIFTRKNLMAIALVALFSVVVVFVGLCIDDAHAVFSKKNPIAAIADGIGLTPIKSTVAGFITLVLVAIYFTVFAAAVVYERRAAIIAGKKPFSLKMLGIYALTFICCAILSLGFGVLIQRPLTAENITTMLLFVGQSVMLGAIIYIVLFAVIGAVAMLVVNFLLVDKPFKFFDDESEPVFDDDDIDHDLSGSFDVDNNQTNQTQGQGGQGGPVGQGGAGEGEGSNLVSKDYELSDAEIVFPELAKIDVKYDGFDGVPMLSDEVTLEEICVRFRNYLAKEEKLYFEPDIIRFFISGFAASHFEILEGLSGTGKSSLPRYFTKFCGGKLLFMPVQATWRDKSNILGFFNEFSKTYSETEFLTSLYDANYGTDEINMYVLDEMNISRVEYYFADLLSVLEYPVPDWKIKVMNVPTNFVPPIKLIDGYIQIPENSYFIGTANKDDSTFTITDKVYDRAITIEFDNFNTPFVPDGNCNPMMLSATHFRSLFEEAKAVTDNQLSQKDVESFNKILSFVFDTFDLAIGNRILHQLETIVPVYVACGGKKEEVIDFMLAKKLISKLDGRFEEYVKGALKDLKDLLASVYGAKAMPRCEKLVDKLYKAL